MDIEMLREFCLSLPGTTEGLKWGDKLCFMISEKIYVITSLDEGGVIFKCDPEDFDELVARDCIQQAPHFAKKQWVTVLSLGVMPDQELKACIVKSRMLVLSKLPKKIQALLS
ncbi:putative DNA-binding protein (MmcQ/YjbR family) [Pedobacter sp. CG_S7]|uniref:MmcQ/YjbR family DNA-binding protein n=1 Tax=Pedobacter sp. CG_S7 TaxID=3143930 RepID=UPI0033981BD7